MAVTIYHNPRCSKSRETLALLRERGIEPTVVEYLTDTPDAATLDALLKKLKLAPRDLMRRKEAPYRELGLDDPALSCWRRTGCPPGAPRRGAGCSAPRWHPPRTPLRSGRPAEKAEA